MPENDDELDIYYWRYDNVPIEELKKWVDDQILKGFKTVTLDIELKEKVGIDKIKITAKK